MKITNWKTCLEVVKSLFLSLNESFVIISHSEKKKHFSKGFFLQVNNTISGPLFLNWRSPKIIKVWENQLGKKIVKWTAPKMHRNVGITSDKKADDIEPQKYNFDIKGNQ